MAQAGTGSSLAGQRKGANALRRKLDATFQGGTALAGLLLVATFGALLYILFTGAWPALRTFGPGFFVEQTWAPDRQVFGSFAYMWGTVVSSLIALVVAVPVAIGTAIALNLLLPRWLSGPVGLLVELLAAVPSIVFGVWGLNTIVPFVATLSGGTSYGRSLLAAGLVLACMILPIITAIARDMLKAVPLAQRDAALALGATNWEVTWKVLLPYARGGLVAATILGFGRAIGETMAVILVIGNKPDVSANLFQPAATLASIIASQFSDPSGPLHTSALTTLGLVLLALSLALSITARWIARRLARRAGT